MCEQGRPFWVVWERGVSGTVVSGSDPAAVMVEAERVHGAGRPLHAWAEAFAAAEVDGEVVMRTGGPGRAEMNVTVGLSRGCRGGCVEAGAGKGRGWEQADRLLRAARQAEGLTPWFWRRIVRGLPHDGPRGAAGTEMPPVFGPLLAAELRASGAVPAGPGVVAWVCGDGARVQWSGGRSVVMVGRGPAREFPVRTVDPAPWARLSLSAVLDAVAKATCVPVPPAAGGGA